MNFEIAAQGMGGKYVLDGIDTCAAMFNPEGDMGDVEMWELICPMIYLSRRIKANSGGVGRHRGGSSFESLHMVHGTAVLRAPEHRQRADVHLAGDLRRLPGPDRLHPQHRDNDLRELAEAGEAYPVADGSFDEPALLRSSGDREYRQQRVHAREPFTEGDLYLSVMKGGGGLGDPLERPVEAVRATSTRATCCPASPSPSTASRTATRPASARLERARPAREWWAERASGSWPQDIIEPVKVACTRSRCGCRSAGRRSSAASGTCRRTSPSTSHAHRPAGDAAKPGKITPEESAAAFLAACGHRGREGRAAAAAGQHAGPETLAPCSTRSSRGARSRTSSPATRTRTVSRSGSQVLQERVPYDDPIVLPVGEGLNVVAAPPTASW